MDASSSSTRSRRHFEERLDRSIRLATEWMISWPERESVTLVAMIADMAALSADQRLHAIVRDYLAGPCHPPGDVWRRWLDPNADVVDLTPEQLPVPDYQRWFVYALAHDVLEMPAAERAAMFDRDRHAWGSRTHQLLALLLYRERVGRTPSLDALIDHLCTKIAREAGWDIRVTDLYLQRLAVILAAGRPDLIKRRWIEKAMASQSADGGWVKNWHGWGPGLFAFTFRRLKPNSHTTVQGAWALYMLKYRYPEWIGRNYGQAG
jgi:hypothetical protein